MTEATIEKEKRIILISKCLLLDDNNRILMVRRHRPWHKESHGKWELPGGKVEFGEHPSDTAIRECKEESGYQVIITGLVPTIYSGVWEHKDRDSNVVVVCYLAKAIGGEASTSDHGVSEVQFFAPSELPKVEDCIPGTYEFLIMHIVQ